MMDASLQEAEKIVHGSVKRGYEHALALCEQVLSEAASTPERYLARDLREAIFSRLGQFEQALDEVAEMIALESKQPHPYFRRARLLLRMGDEAGAVADFTKVIELDDGYFEEVALFLRAVANLEIDKAQSMRDAMLLEDGFSFFARSKRLGLRELSKEQLLEMAKD
ncbi:hypothetical protein [Hydrogenophaga sp. 5NK40-0174]|uniref:hypothetical protein n=1 Tax=Hydrogenophaga sp. 5NK40-0174 TaxID=3127649 RepID=UPI00310997E2